MCMVELPPALAITDTPGVPGAGVRQQLRERFKIEAAVANFGAAPTSVIPIAEMPPQRKFFRARKGDSFVSQARVFTGVP